MERDQRVAKELSEQGIRCMVIWECTIRKMTRSSEYQDQCLRTIIEFIKSNEMYMEL